MIAGLRKSVKFALARGAIGSKTFWRDRIDERAMVSLCYHRIGPVEHDPFQLAVNADDFERQMRSIADHDFLTPVTSADFQDILLARHPYPERIPVLVSFDDGYRDNLEVAAPIMKRYRIPAIMFIATSVLEGQPLWYDVSAECFAAGGGHELDKVLPQSSVDGQSPGAYVDYVNALNGSQMTDAIKALQGFGKYAPRAARYMDTSAVKLWMELGFATGAHTINHPRLTGLSVEHATQEITDSIEQLNAIVDGAITNFAYPFGTRDDFSDNLSRALANSPIEAAFTTVPGRNRPSCNAFELRRRCISNGQFRRPGETFCETLFLADLIGWTPSFALGAAPRKGAPL